MADGVTTQTTTLATIPDATKIATDDAGAAGHVQIIKLGVSTDGSATPLTADNTDGLLVNLGANNDVTVTGTVTANAGTGTMAVSLASLPALAAGTNGIGKLTANSGVTIGAVEIAAAQTLATVTTVGAVTAITNALPAGTNAIGKLAANSGVDIGDVDVTSLPALPTGTNAIGAVTARLGQTRITQTPTISAGSIYASGDAVGGLLTFANAARASGGTITVTAVVIIDADQELAPLELVLFDRTFTATSDNALFDPSDADLANIIGVIKVSDYANFNDNSVATRECRLTAKLNGTDLFGQLVVRSTPTYTATSDITVIVQVVQD